MGNIFQEQVGVIFTLFANIPKISQILSIFSPLSDIYCQINTPIEKWVQGGEGKVITLPMKRQDNKP